MLFDLKKSKKQLFGNYSSHIETHNPNALDFVELGDPSSEKKHQGLEAWTAHNKVVSADYGGPERITYAPFPVSCRDFATKAGIVLIVKPKTALLLRINVHDNPYNIGNKAKLTKVLISFDGREWKEIGSYRVEGVNTKWDTFIFKIKAEDAKGQRMHVLIDDTENFKLGKYGQSVNWIDVSIKK